jgi:nucleoside-diphosphate-sugar epimerase
LNVLVTGSSGFIGSCLCQHFYDEGFNVLGWDIELSNKSWPTYQVDMTNKKSVLFRLKTDRPDIVIHCAGNAEVGKSILNPSSDFSNNVIITHNLCFSLLETQKLDTKLIYLSSAAVYGNTSKGPIKETAELNPISPYALHKVICENICRYLSFNHGMNIKVLRIFSAYGEGLRKQIFWDMYTKYKATGNLRMLGTGNESRDFIHVVDLMQAIYLVATRTSDHFEIYNISNGEETTIRKIAVLYANAAKIEKEKIYFTNEHQQGSPVNWCANIEKISALGYKKTISLVDGIERYVNWISSF